MAATLANRRFAFTAEVNPPLSTRGDDLLAIARPLKGIADAVNVTDGANARAHMDCLAAAAILHADGIEPVLQLTCRDRNRVALQGALVGAAALGVRNVMVLSGDDPSKGDQPEAKPVFDLDSAALVRTARVLRDEAVLPGGRALTGEAAFFLGVADMPIDPPAGWTPVALQRKIEAGAQFAQTQFCMDVGVVRRYLARLAKQG